MLRPRLTGETVRVELDWFTRRDGRMVPVAYSSAPLATDRGRGAVVVFRDVSERLASEETARREPRSAPAPRSSTPLAGRILAAMDAERQRLGRDLHDGAQQRLLHVLLLLGDGKAALEGVAATARRSSSAATAEVRSAIDDVRQLAAGIHPAILTARGLGAAIESITARVPVPVDVDVPADRFAESIEIAAYYSSARLLRTRRSTRARPRRSRCSSSTRRHAPRAGARRWPRRRDRHSGPWPRRPDGSRRGARRRLRGREPPRRRHDGARDVAAALSGLTTTIRELQRDAMETDRADRAVGCAPVPQAQRHGAELGQP